MYVVCLCACVCDQPGYEAEETIKRIKSHKGVQAVLIVNQEGVPIYSSTNDEEFALDHAALISQLAAKAKSTIRTLDPTNDMTFLRIRSKKHEIMIAPGTCRTHERCCGSDLWCCFCCGWRGR